jgi:hypothetical protein
MSHATPHAFCDESGRCYDCGSIHTIDQWRELALAAFEYAKHVPDVRELAIAMGLRTREREEIKGDEE